MTIGLMYIGRMGLIMEVYVSCNGFKEGGTAVDIEDLINARKQLDDIFQTRRKQTEIQTAKEITETVKKILYRHIRKNSLAGRIILTPLAR